MLYKSTLKFLLVEVGVKELLLPVVSNSYKKTLWLLRHRLPEANVIGVVEGPQADLSFMQVGEIDIPTLHNQILRTTNAIYTSIGKQPILPEVFTLDYTLNLNDFIIKYTKLFTPDELLIVLGIGHNKLFRLIAKLVVSKDITYVPVNGPGKWSYYDYYWLYEKYKSGSPRDLDIKPFVNRPNLQIKLRAHSVGFALKTKKKNVSNINVTINTEVVCTEIILSDVQRDYMITQISSVVSAILNTKENV